MPASNAISSVFVPLAAPPPRSKGHASFESWAEAGLYLFLFAVPFSKALMEIAVVFSLSFFLLHKAICYRETYRWQWGLPKSTALWIAAFVLSGFLSAILSLDTRLSFRAFFSKNLEGVSVLYMASQIFRTAKRRSRLYLVLLLSASLIMADALIQYFSGSDLLRRFTIDQGGTLRASFASSNTFACWLIMLLFLGAAAHSHMSSNLQKVWSWVLLPFFMLSLLLTYSRGAWLSLIATGGILIFLYRRYFRIPFSRKLLTGFLAVALMVFSSLWLFAETFRNTVLSLGDWTDSTIANRLLLWDEAVQMIKDFPLFGIGLNTYSRYIPYYVFENNPVGYSHNSFLQMTAETGLVGFAAFLGLLYAVFKGALTHIGESKDKELFFVLAAVISFLSTLLVDVHYYAVNLSLLFWFLMGYSIAHLNRPSQRRMS